MASFWYNTAAAHLAGLVTAIDLDSDAGLRVMLIGTAVPYTGNQDDDFVGTLLSASELSTTNYTPGFGSASRKTPAITITIDDANNRAAISLADLVWAALGPSSGGPTVGGAALIKEVTNDNASIPIAFFDITDTAVNNVTFTLDMTTNTPVLRAAT